MVVQLCEYTRKHQIVYFKQVTCMPCESYLNKATIKFVNDKMYVMGIQVFTVMLFQLCYLLNF